MAANRNAASPLGGDMVQALMDSAVDAIITVDEKGVIRSFNRAAERLFGYDSEEAIGQPISLLMPVPHCARHQQYIERYLATGEPHIIGIGREVQAVRKDGSLLPAYLAVSEFEAAGERLFAGVLHDISADLEARQLRARLAEAESLSKLAETTATLAHELNQPLLAIATYAEAAHRQLQQGDAAKLATTLDKVVEQSLRASVVIESVQRLVNSAAREGRQGVSTQSADINALMADVAALMYTDAHRQGIELVLETAAALPAVHCDPVQIQQVGLNLVRNAIDAVGQARQRHGHAVRVGTRCVENAVEVSVSDSGEGIAASVRDDVFTPFHSNKPGGMGMGLAICRTIIASHNGTLRFHDNTPAPGTTFRFTLPVANDG